MKDFKENLRKAESTFSIPHLAKEFENFDNTVQNKCEEAWEKVKEHVLMDFAAKLQIDLSMTKDEVRLIYLSLLKRYISTLLEYPSKSALKLNVTIDDISLFLVNHGYDNYIVAEEKYKNIDIFLYLDTNVVKSCSGKNIKVPFYIGINYDNSTEEDYITKIGDLNVITISTAGLQEKLEKDFEFIDMIRFEQYYALREF